MCKVHFGRNSFIIDFEHRSFATGFLHSGRSVPIFLVSKKYADHIFRIDGTSIKEKKEKRGIDEWISGAWRGTENCSLVLSRTTLVSLLSAPVFQVWQSAV